MLSTKDRDRLKVLHEVRQGHLTQREAGEQLGFTDRWVRQLLGRVKKEGDRGVVHGLRGRVSNRRLPEKVRRKDARFFRGCVKPTANAALADLLPILPKSISQCGQEEVLATPHRTCRSLSPR